MKTILLALLVLVAVASAQNTFTRMIIDNFGVGENHINIIIPNNPTFPIEVVDFYTDSSNSPNGLLGGERDLKLAAENGPANRILTSDVDNSIWVVSTPSGASGFANMQWDGKDASFNLNVNGLGGLDLTDGGLGEAFRCTIETDIETEYTFTVTSTNGNDCPLTLSIPRGSDDYVIPFSSFSGVGNCDLTNVGAIDIFIEQFENVDSLISNFIVIGQNDPSASRTPSPAANPSNSRTPSPGISPSRTPTPSPEPVMECMCHCPAFTCELIFDPDDDENNVFYFDDDDHNPFGEDNTSGGAITDSADLVSGSSVLELSIAIIAVIVVAMF